jgi:quinol monooxygenase YgiN
MAGRVVAVTRIHGIAGRRAELRELMRRAEAVAASEPGCLRYQFGITLGGADEYVHVQEWAADDAFDAHQRSPGFRDYQLGLVDLLARPSEMEVHRVSETVAPRPSAPMDPRTAD